MTATDRALLAAVLDELRGLRADLARRDGRRDDPEADGRLLVALAAAAGSRVFTAGDILRHAHLDSNLSGALEAAGLRTCRALGAVLRRLRDQAIDGLVLRALGREAGGMLWSVVHVEDRHTGGSASVAFGG